MNIKCFSDLEKWMQGIVKQVQVATGTKDAVCFQFNAWNPESDMILDGSSIWVAEHKKHYPFENYRELCVTIEDLETANHRDKLFRRF